MRVFNLNQRPRKRGAKRLNSPLAPWRSFMSHALYKTNGKTYTIIAALVLAIVVTGWWGWLEMKDAGDQTAHVARLKEENKILAAEARANVRTEPAPPTVPSRATLAGARIATRYPTAAIGYDSKYTAHQSDGIAKEVELGQNIDCGNTSSDPEQKGCNDTDLTKIDLDLNDAYSTASGRTGNKEQLENEQLEWSRSTHKSCASKACILDAYSHRISELAQSNP